MESQTARDTYYLLKSSFRRDPLCPPKTEGVPSQDRLARDAGRLSTPLLQVSRGIALGLISRHQHASLLMPPVCFVCKQQLALNASKASQRIVTSVQLDAIPSAGVDCYESRHWCKKMFCRLLRNLSAVEVSLECVVSHVGIRNSDLSPLALDLHALQLNVQLHAHPVPSVSASVRYTSEECCTRLRCSTRFVSDRKVL